MAEKLGEAVLELRTDQSALDRGISEAETKASALAGKFDAFGQRAQAVGGRLSLAVTAPLLLLAKESINAARDSEKALVSVEAALESMGHQAGFTSDQLQAMASEFQATTLFDADEILQKVTANLLTFGNVSDDAFARAQKAALDLSARLGTDLQSSTVMLGKALNDPIAGLTALTRVGVSFTEQQKDQIKAMAEAGDLAGAQAVILSELERQYGGQAEAAAAADGGVTQLANSWGDFQEQIGAVLIEFIEPLVGGLGSLSSWLQSLDDDTRKWVVGLALGAAALGPVLMMIGMMASGIGSLITVFAPLTAAVTATFGAGGVFAGAFGSLSAFGSMLSLVGGAIAPFLAPLAAVAAAGALIYATWDKIAPVMEALRTKMVETLGPKLQALIETVQTRLTALWNGPLGDGIRVVIDWLGQFSAAYISVLGEGLLRVVSAAVSAIDAGFKIVTDVIGIVIALLTGDFASAWEGLKSLVGNVITGVVNILNSLVPEAVKVVSEMAANFTNGLGQLAASMVTMGRNIVDGIVKGILAAPEAVWNALKSVVLRGVANVRAMLGIASPSRLFMSFGGFVSEGLAIGIMNGMPQVEAAMDKLSGAVAGNLTLPDAGELPTLPGLGDGEQGSADLRDTFRQTFADGIQAALRGDLGGFLNQFFNRMFDGALREAADALGGLLFGGGGGNGGGLLASIGSLFAGFFATGGTIPSGSFGIVGERGPELAFAGSGGLGILSNADSGKLLSSGAGGGTNVSIPINIDATGADSAAIARLNSRLDQLQAELPGRIVTTIQDASNRRLINVGGGR